MKIITWNIRGLNSIHKLDVVRNFVREQKSDFLLLQEIKMDKEKAEQIKSFKDYCLKASSVEGASGGTLMMWKSKYYIGTVLKTSKHLMVVKISSNDHNKVWYIVNVYAANIKNQRKKVWDTLSHIKSMDYSG